MRHRQPRAFLFHLIDWAQCRVACLGQILLDALSKGPAHFTVKRLMGGRWPICADDAGVQVAGSDFRPHYYASMRIVIAPVVRLSSPCIIHDDHTFHICGTSFVGASVGTAV